MNGRRNKQIDTAKGILMTLVIVGHVLLASADLNRTESMLLKIIYSFHMPAFLIISGILFDCDKQKEKSFSKEISNKFRRIMVPYFIFELLGGIVHNAFAYGEKETISTILKNILTFDMYVGADWYLLTYFLTSILLFSMNKLKEEKTILYVTGVMFYIIAYICQRIGISDDYVFVLRILLMYSLVVIGIMLKNIMLQFNRRGLFVLVLGFALASALNSTVFLHAAMIGNPVLFLMSSICGTYIILCLSAKVGTDFFGRFGRYSIVPMGIHQDLIWIFGWFFGLSGEIKVIVPNLLFAYGVSVLVTMIYAKIKEKGCEYESNN